MKKILIQFLSIILIILLIISLVLLVAKLINPLYFWIILAVCAIIAFFVIPKIKTRKK